MGHVHSGGYGSPTIVRTASLATRHAIRSLLTTLDVRLLRPEQPLFSVTEIQTGITGDTHGLRRACRPNLRKQKEPPAGALSCAQEDSNLRPLDPQSNDRAPEWFPPFSSVSLSIHSNTHICKSYFPVVSPAGSGMVYCLAPHLAPRSTVEPTSRRHEPDSEDSAHVGRERGLWRTLEAFPW